MIIDSESAAREYVTTLGNGAALEKLHLLEAELRKENELQNLVARNSLDFFWQRHIADSAQLLSHVDGGGGPWLDLGSGAGFPGLVIAALKPQTSVILVESRKRRIEWLDRMCGVLSLENCRVEGARLESMNGFAAGVISARAFAPLERLLRLSARFSTSRTCWVLPKGRSAAQEVGALSRIGRKMFHVEQSLTDSQAGIVVGKGRWKENA